MIIRSKTIQPIRRTQAERRETTRKELVRATIQVIEERGLEGASIYEIARAAGMTPGAIQHHYASKWALIAEAAAHLVQMDDQYGSVEVWPKTSGTLQRRSRTAITSAWNAMYAAPHYLTMWSIFLSCRTEAQLLDAMASEREQLRQRMLAGFYRSFPELENYPQGEDIANLVFSTLRGMGLNRLFKLSPAAQVRQLHLLADAVAGHCASATANTAKNLP